MVVTFKMKINKSQFTTDITEFKYERNNYEVLCFDFDCQTSNRISLNV